MKTIDIDRKQVEEYLLERMRVTVAEIQHRFSLLYPQAREVVRSYEKRKWLRFEGGIYFGVNEKMVETTEKGCFFSTRLLYEEHFRTMDANYREGLKACLENDSISYRTISNEVGVRNDVATAIVDWLKATEVIDTDGKLKMKKNVICEILSIYDEEHHYVPKKKKRSTPWDDLF